MRNHGVTMMPIGLMTNEDQAVIGGGPMLMGALQQMMTLSQKAPVNGAVIVSTPQDVALLDARKGIDMFQQLGVPIPGMIENMSTHICTNCGHEEHLFGHGGVAAEAEKLGVPLLAEVPLDLQIRLAADGGARALHTDWSGLAHGIGAERTTNGITGTFLGVDEDFGMLLRDAAGRTHVIALTTLLETAP